MQRFGLESPPQQRLGQFCGPGPGTGENQRTLDVFHLQQPGQCRQFVGFVHHVVPLLRLGDGHPLVVGRDCLRLLHVLLGQAADGIRQRRREEHRLARRRGLTENRLNVLDETHGQHLIGLVQHQETDATQVQHPLADQIQQPARRADDDVYPTLQPPDLATVCLPTIDRQDPHVTVLAIAIDGLRDLVRQFAGRGQNQPLYAGALQVQIVQHRERKGRCLTRACLCLPQDVAPGQNCRDCTGLNGGRILVP